MTSNISDVKIESNFLPLNEKTFIAYIKISHPVTKDEVIITIKHQNTMKLSEIQHAIIEIFNENLSNIKSPSDALNIFFATKNSSILGLDKEIAKIYKKFRDPKYESTQEGLKVHEKLTTEEKLKFLMEMPRNRESTAKEIQKYKESYKEEYFQHFGEECVDSEYIRSEEGAKKLKDIINALGANPRSGGTWGKFYEMVNFKVNDKNIIETLKQFGGIENTLKTGIKIFKSIQTINVGEGDISIISSNPNHEMASEMVKKFQHILNLVQGTTQPDPTPAAPGEPKATVPAAPKPPAVPKPPAAPRRPEGPPPLPGVVELPPKRATDVMYKLPQLPKKKESAKVVIGLMLGGYKEVNSIGNRELIENRNKNESIYADNILGLKLKSVIEDLSHSTHQLPPKWEEWGKLYALLNFVESQQDIEVLKKNMSNDFIKVLRVGKDAFKEISLIIYEKNKKSQDVDFFRAKEMAKTFQRVLNTVRELDATWESWDENAWEKAFDDTLLSPTLATSAEPKLTARAALHLASQPEAPELTSALARRRDLASSGASPTAPEGSPRLKDLPPKSIGGKGSEGLRRLRLKQEKATRGSSPPVTTRSPPPLPDKTAERTPSSPRALDRGSVSPEAPTIGVPPPRPPPPRVAPGGRGSVSSEAALRPPPPRLKLAAAEGAPVTRGPPPAAKGRQGIRREEEMERISREEEMERIRKTPSGPSGIPLPPPRLSDPRKK